MSKTPQTNRSAHIPKQVESYPLIKVCSPNCKVHVDCAGGKRPVTSSGNDKSVEKIDQWVSGTGNYGVVARDTNDLTIFDSDSEEFSEILKTILPETFVVASGGEGFGEHWYVRTDDYRINATWNSPDGSIRTGGNDGWFVVGPNSTHGKTGNKYTVKNDNPIAHVSKDKLERITRIFNEKDSNVSTDTPARSTSNTHRKNSTLGFIRRDDIRNDILDILHTNSTHLERVWAVGWLHGAAGLKKREIVDIIMDEARWDKLDRDLVEYHVEFTIKKSRTGRGEHYENYTS